MRRLAYSRELSGRSRAEVFCRQAEFMADFEEEEDVRASFFCYYPTFAEMSARELRAYFSWRTAWRRGEHRQTSLSFVYVRIYELLNSIGFKTPLDAYLALIDFVDDYRQFDRSIDFHARNWLNDFVIYHGLDRQFLRPVTRNETETAAASILSIDTLTPKLVLAGFRRLSSWKLEGPFYEAHAEKLDRLILAVLRKLKATTLETRRNALEAAIGPRLLLTYRPFAAAVFWDRRLREDRCYEADPIVRYRTSNGRWMREELAPGRGRNSLFGDIAKRIEAMLRQQVGYRRKLTAPSVSELVQKCIDEAFSEDARREREASNPVRALDFSRLSAIRSDAAETQAKLVVPEAAMEEVSAGNENGEKPRNMTTVKDSAHASTNHTAAAESAEPVKAETTEESPEESVASSDSVRATIPNEPLEESSKEVASENSAASRPQPIEASDPVSSQASTDGLTTPEKTLLSLLLNGDNPASAIKAIGRSPERIIDDINEKLFDCVGDAVLEMRNGTLSLISDYAEEIEDILAQR